MMLNPTTNTPNNPPEPAPADYSTTLNALLKSGWEMLSEGPSGAQLRGPKKMLLQTKAVIVIGAVLAILNIWALALVAVAALDYAIQKPVTYFLSRDRPELPPKAKFHVSGVFVLLFVLIAAGVIGALFLP